MDSIIKQVNKLLNDHSEWQERYSKYIEEIQGHMNKGIRRPFQRPEGLSLYSSVSRRDGREYDLRFDGQSVGKVVCSRNGVRLIPQEKNNTNYFKEEYSELQLSEGVKWHSIEARKFRRFFRDKSKDTIDIKLNSSEHRLENRLLKEFAKGTRAERKVLCNIQPVKLYNCFFQLPTPLKASTHNPEYASEKGGGIDILARVKSIGGGSRICVMELKDENKKGEGQKEVMKQAVSYASFLARLLRSKSGQNWWDFIMNRDVKSKSIPAELHIDVVTVMPEGETEEFCDKEIRLSKLSTILHCHSLYFDKNDYLNGIFNFSGTYPSQIKK